MANVELRDKFAAFYEELSYRKWSSPAVETKWMGYLFHVTSLLNAVSIIDTGTMLSRNLTAALGAMQTDNADPGIIETTPNSVKDCVRLCFRPRVPTFFHNEGFKSQQELALSHFTAHCPVPVAFVFDAPRILSLDGVRYSNGTLASPSAKQFTGITKFRTLPFEQIYHDGVITDPTTKSDIIFHRQAEVVVPDQLSLSHALVGIYCRSDAELMTLRHLLPAKALERYSKRLRTNSDGSLFEAKRLFVESVTSVGNEVVFVFNPPQNNYGFDAEFIARFGSEEVPNVVEDWYLEPRVHKRVIIPVDTGKLAEVRAELSLHLDGHLAYSAFHWLRSEDWITF